MIALKILYWACIALILYHHVGYPLLLKLIARFRPSGGAARVSNAAPNDYPSITLIVPCHNEASVIAEKIENTAQLQYPRESLLVTLALDGCTDDTRVRAENAIAQLSGLFFLMAWLLAQKNQ